MKRKVILLTVLILAVAVAACSTSEEFIIANNSDADLVVQFSYKDKRRIIYKPRITTMDKLDETGRKWEKLPDQFYDIDADTRVVKVKLSPKEALLVTTANNYTGHDSEDFNIEMISLSGSGGNLKFEDKEAQTQFKKQDNGNYVIFYE